MTPNSSPPTASEPPRCPRCGGSQVVMVKPSMFRGEEPTCGWCGAYHRGHYRYEPFIAYRPHSPELADMHDEAATLRPHPSTARWDPEDRSFILQYLAWRDHERCGLCAMHLPAGVGHIEHIVPKRFGRFDHRRGLVTSGSGYESRLHHVDNLQAAHDYCNRAKGNSPKVVDWRHPDMWSLPVAINRTAPPRLPVGARRPPVCSSTSPAGPGRSCAATGWSPATSAPKPRTDGAGHLTVLPGWQAVKSQVGSAVHHRRAGRLLRTHCGLAERNRGSHLDALHCRPVVHLGSKVKALDADPKRDSHPRKWDSPLVLPNVVGCDESFAAEVRIGIHPPAGRVSTVTQVLRSERRDMESPPVRPPATARGPDAPGATVPSRALAVPSAHRRLP